MRDGARDCFVCACGSVHTAESEAPQRAGDGALDQQISFDDENAGAQQWIDLRCTRVRWLHRDGIVSRFVYDLSNGPCTAIYAKVEAVQLNRMTRERARRNAGLHDNKALAASSRNRPRTRSCGADELPMPRRASSSMARRGSLLNRTASDSSRKERRRATVAVRTRSEIQRSAKESRMRSLWLVAVWSLLMGCAAPMGGAEVPTCEQVCAAVASQCGASSPQCASACASLSDETKRCVTGASSCAAAQGCFSAMPADAGMTDSATSAPDASSMNPDPCSRCTGLQFCVRDRGGANPRCWDPPESCDGRASSACDACAYRAGSGPCERGARSCSSGAAGRTIDCM